MASIGRKLFYLLEAAERDKGIKLDDLWIDIGAKNKADALKFGGRGRFRGHHAGFH